MLTLLTAALAATVALSACSGSNQMLTNPTVPPAKTGTTAPVQTLRIVGVGDSLTAGVQSGGLLGVNLPVLGTSPIYGEIGPVQQTQENGFYSLLWQQANGVGLSTMSDPALSPLPLIGANAVGDLLAPTTSGFPASVTTYCDTHQIVANEFATALTLRLNPKLNPYDVGIPGQTVHEALYMNGAIGTCNPVPAAFVPLNSLVNGESQNFWPILAGFGNGVTQVSVAASLHGDVDTVWLGSNDLLKVAFSGGAAPGTSPASHPPKRRHSRPQRRPNTPAPRSRRRASGPRVTSRSTRSSTRSRPLRRHRRLRRRRSASATTSATRSQTKSSR